METIKLTVSANGAPRDLELGKDYKVEKSGGNGSWSQYKYIIDKSVFEGDGTYIVTALSVDKAGNINQNIDESKAAEIGFGIDTTPPVIVPINIEKDKMNSEVGFGRKVLQAFEESGISFEHMPSGIDTLTVLVHQDEFQHKEQAVLANLHRAVRPDAVEMESDLSLIAVVGRGMRAQKGTAATVFKALAAVDVNIKMIDQGSSELNIIIGVNNDDFEESIRTIYAAFEGWNA